MPRASQSNTTGLYKPHTRACRARPGERRVTACRCPWYGRYGNHVVQLSRWAGQAIDPHDLTAARKVFTRMVAAIDAHAFDPAGEFKTRTSGTTLKEFIEEWWKDRLELRGLEPDLDEHPMPSQWNVVATGTLGREALHDLTTDAIADWLKTQRTTRKWGNKSYNEYRQMLQRFLNRAVERRTLKFNPVLAIKPLKAVDKQRGELKHFRLDEDIEDALFRACPRLNRPYLHRAKLTYDQAETIRARVAAGETGAALAREYKVSPTVVCQVVQKKIWKQAERPTTTKGNEMRRRLIAAFDMGPRAGEMGLVQLAHVDWRHPQKLVDPASGQSFNGYRVELPPENTKSGKTTGETQYLYAATLRASRMLEARRFQLKGNPPDRTYIFGTEDGRCIKSFRKSWRALFTIVFHELGLEWGRKKGIVWHTTRAEFGSRVNENEKDITIAKDLLRHADVKTTMRYIHTRQDRHWQAAHGLNRGNG